MFNTPVNVFICWPIYVITSYRWFKNSHFFSAIFKIQMVKVVCCPVSATSSFPHHSDKLQVRQVQAVHQQHDPGNRLSTEEERRQQPLRLRPHGQPVHPALQQPGLQRRPAGDLTLLQYHYLLRINK